MNRLGVIREAGMLVPLLCLAVAAGQFSCATRGTLTPWRGGGFGMFSVIDSPPERYIRIKGLTADGREVRVLPRFGRVPRPEALTTAYAGRLSIVPTHEGLLRVARAIANADLGVLQNMPGALNAQLRASQFWPYLAAEARIPTWEVVGSTRKEANPNILVEVTAQVLRYRFDKDRHMGVIEPVAEAVFRADRGEPRVRR